MLIVGAACKKDAAPADPGGDKAGDCATVLTAAIDHVAHSGIDEGAKNGAPAGEVARIKKDLDASLAPLKKATIQACNEDKWSAEARSCIATKLKLEECADKLTEAQNKHVGELVEAATKKTGSPSVREVREDGDGVRRRAGRCEADNHRLLYEGREWRGRYDVPADRAGDRLRSDGDRLRWVQECVDDKKATTTPK